MVYVACKFKAFKQSTFLLYYFQNPKIAGSLPLGRCLRATGRISCFE